MSGKKRARDGQVKPVETVQPAKKSQYVGVTDPVTPLKELSKWIEVIGEELEKKLSCAEKKVESLTEAEKKAEELEKKVQSLTEAEKKTEGEELAEAQKKVEDQEILL